MNAFQLPIKEFLIWTSAELVDFVDLHWRNFFIPSA
jgi:hypothetical protein